MKAAIGSLGAAIAASACCIGPVLFSLLGAGALGASAVRMEPYRPWLIGVTVLFVGAAFYSAYRPLSVQRACVGDTCAPQSRRTARLIAWFAALLAAVLLAFPYYIGWFV